jgi:hypothetical protein
MSRKRVKWLKKTSTMVLAGCGIKAVRKPLRLNVEWKNCIRKFACVKTRDQTSKCGGRLPKVHEPYVFGKLRDCWIVLGWAD